MKAQNAFFKRLSTIKNLPSLPHILLKLIEACNHDNQDLIEIGEMVGKDPVLSAKILKLVNSAYFGLPRKVDVINQAVVLVGTSGIKNMAICACVYDAFPKTKSSAAFNLKRFWWHSLRCAFLAKHMAARDDLGHPDEAFLSGLLHDIGKAVLWVNFSKPYEALLEQCGNDTDFLLAGEAHMGATHAEVGAWLLDRWHLDPPIVDCVRYHHEAAERIAQALTTVQIVHVANLLCKENEAAVGAGVATAGDLFGLDPAQCQALIEKSDEEARDVAASLDIDVDSPAIADRRSDQKEKLVQDRLTREVRDLSLTLGMLEGFLTAEDQSGILRCIADGLSVLFDVQRSLFFLLDEKKNALVGYLPDRTAVYQRHPRLAVSMRMTDSLLVGALRQDRAVDSFAAETKGPLAIVDDQLIRLLGGQGMFCLPLVAQKDPVGVLAIGLGPDDLPHLLENTRLMKVFIHKGASALRLERLRRRELQLVQATRVDASIDLARRVIHEVNNPLSVIKNYLKVIGMRMTEAGLPHDELRIMNEEIARVGRLLGKLTSFSKSAAPVATPTDVNALLADILALADDGLLRRNRIQLHTQLEPSLPPVAADADSLKQVFINLIKNAAEAMAERGGHLVIRTRHLGPPLGDPPAPGETGADGMVEIVLQDDGPGIAEAIREKLFDPYASTKGDGHSGLGLSVVHNTITALHGTITCESAPGEGTTFTIELPVKRS